MRNDFPTEETIRKYLLGRFDDQADVERRLSEQIFLDAELSEMVDLIEDEIIEEYLDNNVNAADARIIEEYFLRPPERKEKLQFTRLLRQHFNPQGETVAKKKLKSGQATSEALDDKKARPLILDQRSHFRTYCELAACVLLIAGSLVYMSKVRRESQAQLEAARKSQTQLEDELARERERSTNLAKQLEQVHPPVATLTFWGPVFRDEGRDRIVEVQPWTQRIRVEIGLRDTSSGDYDVRLEDIVRTTIWSQAKIAASSGGLRFEIPVERISTGTYCLIVSSQPQPYCFRVRVSRTG